MACKVLTNGTIGHPLRQRTWFILAAYSSSRVGVCPAAGDGAGSAAREQLGVCLEGREGLQSLINVHFTSPALAAALRRSPAMLYFVYARTTVLVLVAHDLSRGVPPRRLLFHTFPLSHANVV